MTRGKVISHQRKGNPSDGQKKKQIGSLMLSSNECFYGTSLVEFIIQGRSQ